MLFVNAQRPLFALVAVVVAVGVGVVPPTGFPNIQPSKHFPRRGIGDCFRGGIRPSQVSFSSCR